MTSVLLWIYAAAVGAVIGSFLNVCIYRWPAEQSVIRPRSRCPACAEPIRWFDNIPILGWLWLRGACRRCGAPISVQYPLVELATALIWLAAAIRFGPDVAALHSAIFLTLLLGIAMTDAREMVIPDQFSLGGVVLGLTLAALPGGLGFVDALIGGGVAYVLLWIVKATAEKLLGKPALGVGDIHMMAMIGAFLGLGGALLTIFLGSLLGLLIGVPYTWLRGRLSALQTYLPLGVFLAMGAAAAHVWGAGILDWYMVQVLGM
jgi:leader peptidase (prepilin peptidase)/N-methyltransferase